MSEFLKNNEIINLVKFNVHFLNKLAKEGNKCFIPLMTIIASNKFKNLKKTIVQISIPEIPESTEKKHEIMFKIGQEVAEKGFLPLAVIFNCEGWMSTFNNKNEIIPPSLNPEKTEVIIVTCLTIDKKACSICLQIRRKFEGDVVLVPFKHKEYTVIDLKQSKNPEILEPYILYPFYQGVISNIIKE